MIKTIDDFKFRDKLVLLRTDVNVPVSRGKVIDAPRFREAAKTIRELMAKGAKVVVIAHQGRKGDSDFMASLEQHARVLSKYAGRKIDYVDDLFGDRALGKINSLERGEAILMKNVRCFGDELELKGSRFYSFSKLFDIYVNDAFSVCHRSHGSIVIPPSVIDSGMGRYFEEEVDVLNKFNPSKIKNGLYLLGGAKIDDYLPMFDVLKNKNNRMIVSGVLANLILMARGVNLGYENKWLKKEGYDKMIPEFRKIYLKYGKQIILPVDFAVGNRNVEKIRGREEVSMKDAPFELKIWDIGHESVKIFKEAIGKAKLVFMKGPMGYSEIGEFRYATVEILREIAKVTKKGKVYSLLGGGHLTTSIKKYKIPNTFSHISLEGGALIQFVSGKKLPGLEALK